MLPKDCNLIKGAAYTAEMQAELDRIEALAPGKVDFSRPPDAEARRIDAELSAFWNVDLPEVESVRRFNLPADPSIGAAACEAVVYRPASAGDGVIFFVHGGGWAFMDLHTHERFMRLLCNEARTTLIGVHYRLAPENPYPAALKDVVSAFRKVLAQRTEIGLPEGPVIIAGDSAGANLALATMLHEIDARRERPVGGILFYGVFGANFETPSYRAYADAHILTRPIMQQLWDWYLPDASRRSDPLAAPLMASDDQLRALPPLFLVAAEIDPLASDTIALKQRLDALGRDDAIWMERGAVHGFLQMTAVLEAGRRVMREAANVTRRFIATAKQH